MILTIRGKVSSGLGEGKKFTELDWFIREVEKRLGFKPSSGTLNILVPHSIGIGNLLLKIGGWCIPERNGYFSAKLYEAKISKKISGGIVRPDIPSYPEDLIEVVAPVNLRKELGLQDGDAVEVQIRLK
ncbi:MAG: DUF120 domain-containing protein [Nitrososphaerota archaeon]|nr:CTP-dependent riboflavin kinase [Candidatus Bathyarchaeota archaeon]MDW8048727.1 DUF120 domain-containing protein [Nitrososphaerota archaeon]